MFRLNKLTDYGLVLLTHFAKDEKRTWNARDLAQQSNVPLPTVSKLLKLLSKGHLLESHRGAAGGYRLVKHAQAVSVAEVITALEGPVGMTECTSGFGEICSLEAMCPVRANWRKINTAVADALESLTLAQLTHPLPQQWGQKVRGKDL